MDVEILREFLTVSDELNFSTSAEKCHLSQPTLSRHIQALEKEVGCKLFERKNNTVTLTPQGSAFIPGVKSAISSYDQALSSMHSVSEKSSNTLTVLYMENVSRKLIDDAYAMQLKLHPYVKVRLLSSWERRIALLMDRGKADIAITPLTTEPDPLLWDTLTLYKDTFSLVVPSWHVLHNHNTVSVRQISNGEVVLLPNEKDYPFQFGHLSSAIKKKTRGVIIKDDILDKHDIAALCNSGQGIAIARTELASTMNLGDAHAIPLSDVELRYRVAAIWLRASTNDALPGFIDVLKKVTHTPKERAQTSCAPTEST